MVCFKFFVELNSENDSFSNSPFANFNKQDEMLIFHTKYIYVPDDYNVLIIKYFCLRGSKY